MTALTTSRHRVSAATAEMRASAASVVDASVWSMDAAETAATLTELTHLAAQVAELTARVAAHADDLHVGAEVGASSAASWLAHTTNTTRPAAAGTVKLGHSLEAHPLTRDALAHGDVLVDQARVIVHAVDQLPDHVDTELAEQAEAHLLAEAAHHDAKALRVLGKHLVEVIAPDEADAREAAILEAEEKAAAKACHLAMYDDGHGKTHGRFTIPTAEGAVLRKMLLAFAAPKHQAATTAERHPTADAMGRAFAELILHIPAEHLPKTGSLPATMLVLIDEDSLLGRVEKAGVLDTGEKFNPALARRLACEAEIIPIVLGGASMPLDVGRARRLHTKHQRYALLARDHGCRAQGCDRTHGLHAHHTTRWPDGGHTTVDDAITLCHWHHQRAHDTTYETTYLPNGDVTFHRRQ
ncbi:HNH endonuclease signature motif containing protein [Nocardioides sp. SR21]|uniref:HNH endonuclease n=1 Tax=Nocardioides sp. SR21 TaxID=2919501 RepID=UPI001FAB06B2|nr:HNH endonuclease signature motif containing protein [Nocardioides sp. SR21]